MDTFTITISAMPAHTTAALRSMLLLEPALGARWQVVDRPPADVVLLPAETLARLKGVAGGPDELPLYLALGNDGERPSNAYAMLKRPITPPRLVEVLHLAEGLIEKLRAPQDDMLTVPLIESLEAHRARRSSRPRPSTPACAPACAQPPGGCCRTRSPPG